MSEGLGSTVVIVVIVVFIALVSAYMAYNVNYTKAFRMKNKIIYYYEEYNGECNNECKEKIRDYAKEIGYHPKNDDFCSRNPHKPVSNLEGLPQYINDPGYCEYKVKVPKVGGTGVVDDTNHEDGYYYRIATIINIRVPIIENVMQFNYVSGDTKDFQYRS